MTFSLWGLFIVFSCSLSYCCVDSVWRCDHLTEGRESWLFVFIWFAAFEVSVMVWLLVLTIKTKPTIRHVPSAKTQIRQSDQGLHWSHVPFIASSLSGRITLAILGGSAVSSESLLITHVLLWDFRALAPMIYTDVRWWFSTFCFWVACISCISKVGFVSHSSKKTLFSAKKYWAQLFKTNYVLT